MKCLKVSKTEQIYALCDVSHTGIRVFYRLNHVTIEKCYKEPSAAALEIKNILSNAELEEKDLFENLKVSLLAYNLELKEDF